MSKAMTVGEVLNMTEALNMSEIMNMSEVTNMSEAMNMSGDCQLEWVERTQELTLLRRLSIFALVHCCAVIVVGGLGSGVAVWCVATCQKTRVAVKLLLHTVFLPVLLVSVLTKPMAGRILLALCMCDPSFDPSLLINVAGLTYSIFALTEMIAITAVAVVRAVAVWSPQRHGLELKTAVLIVVGIVIYSVATCCGVMLSLIIGQLDVAATYRIMSIVYFVNALLPCVITASCYASMIVAVRLNKRRLGQSGQHGQGGGVLDQATRAMLAVFISNMIFGLTHAIYHLFDSVPLDGDLSIHILFDTHYIVDPWVFLWFNRNYRERVLGVITGFLKRIYTISSKQPSTSLASPPPPDTSPQRLNVE